MRKGLLLFMQLFFLSVLFGQNKSIRTLHGFIYDVNTKEVLIGANLYAPSIKRGATTNEYGFYSLSLPMDDSIDVYISIIGYKTDTNKISKNHEGQMDFYLSLDNVLQEVVISSSKDDNVVNRNETGVVRIQMNDIKALPNLFGEVDIIKAYQLTPGVQSGGEGKSNIYIRGGSPDQNLILLDDVPLYNITHFGGFISVFNADAINDVKLIKGGFPARYGGRLSSVLDVRMKEGNMQKWDVQGAVGLLSSKVSIEGPILKDKLSFIISARKNTLPIFKILQSGIGYSFYDINAKFNYRLSLKDKLFLSFYTGDDVVSTRVKQAHTENKNAVKWGNMLGSFRWNHIFNEKLFGNLTFSDTYYRFKTIYNYSITSDSTSKKISNTINSGINDLSCKMDFSYIINSKTNLKYGLNSIYHQFIPNDQHYVQSGNTSETVNKKYSSAFNALENAVYVENELKLKIINSNIGARFSSYHVKGKDYYSLEPRALLNFILRKDLSIKYSFAKTRQYIHLLTYSGTGVPSDYWMPTNENVKPESAFQHTLSLNKTFKNGIFEVSLEGYYKTIYNLITFKPGESLLSNLDSWENVVEKNGKGTNYGMELFLQKIQGSTTGWIGATVSKAERIFENINNGEAFPFKYDRPVDLSFVLNHRFKKNITLSVTWTYGTGYPVTLATEHYTINGEEIFVYDKMNSYRMRDYHRLDFSANFPKKTKWGERTWSVSILNVYNRKNSYYYYYEREIIGNNWVPVYSQWKLYQRSLFGILPSLSYNFKFLQK
jgi:TonB-dependent Receptor Plug Domain/CarboxypepD_reg-like domain